MEYLTRREMHVKLGTRVNSSKKKTVHSIVVLVQIWATESVKEIVRRGCRVHWGWTLNTHRTVLEGGKLPGELCTWEVLNLEHYLGIEVLNTCIKYLVSNFMPPIFNTWSHGVVDTQVTQGSSTGYREHGWGGEVEKLLASILDKIAFQKDDGECEMEEKSAGGNTI